MGHLLSIPNLPRFDDPRESILNSGGAGGRGVSVTTPRLPLSRRIDQGYKVLTLGEVGLAMKPQVISIQGSRSYK